VITCKRCGKDNQDHYKFCLGCGSELTQAAPAKADSGGVAMMKTVMADPGSRPAPARSPTPPGGLRPVGTPLPGLGAQPAAPAKSAPVPGVAPAIATAPAPAPAPLRCPSCGADIPPGFKFCGQCGTKIEAPPSPRNTADIARQPPPATRPRGQLVLIRPDGSEGGLHPLEEGENRIGRDHGELFENDGYLSPTHAEIILNAAGAVVRDLGSLNGVFLRMIDEEEMESGQIFRIGQELIRFDTVQPPEPTADGTEIMGSPNPGYWGRLSIIIGEGVDGSAFPLLGDSVTLGRERGDINFPDDGYVSGLHARVSTRNGKYYLADLGSSNGTFIKVSGERAMAGGAFALLGQQLFKLSVRT
jgi:pSer/pThr/pTyr-binding forkhead associated (FHA) protein